MVDTAFLRSDELPGRAALGYLDTPTAAHQRVPPARAGQRRRRRVHNRRRHQRFWDGAVRRTDRAAGAGRRDGAAAQRWPEESRRYGLGFWLHATGDRSGSRGTTRASRSSACTASSATTYTVISNWSQGAWPIIKLLDDRVGTAISPFVGDPGALGSRKITPMVTREVRKQQASTRRRIEPSVGVAVVVVVVYMAVVNGVQVTTGIDSPGLVRHRSQRGSHRGDPPAAATYPLGSTRTEPGTAINIVADCSIKADGSGFSLIVSIL